MNEIETMEDVIGFDALFDSMMKCKKGVTWKGSVASYYLNGIERSLKLERELKNGTYRAGKPITFTITHPKKREIVSVKFRDRVYQRSLNDIKIYPMVAERLLPENTACQKGKGTDYARKMLLGYMRNMQKENNSQYYVLQCDIKGYYPNMQHSVALDTFRDMIVDDDVYSLAAEILTDQYAGDIGYNPGSQMIQIVGISALDYIDRYIIKNLGITYYVRYMDDFILMHPDSEYLCRCKDWIKTMLAVRGFELHERKTKIYNIKKGIKFLGFVFKPKPSGKIMVSVSPEKVKAEKRKLRKIVLKVARGELPAQKAFEHYQIWRSTVVWDGRRKSKKKSVVKHGFRSDNHKMAVRMDAYFKYLRNQYWRKSYEFV